MDDLCSNNKIILNYFNINKLDGQVTQYLLENYKNNEFATFSLDQAGWPFQEQQQLYHDYWSCCKFRM